MNAKLPIENVNGITVKELINWLSNFPEDGEVWIETKVGISNPVYTCIELNDGSVMFQTHRQNL